MRTYLFRSRFSENALRKEFVGKAGVLANFHYDAFLYPGYVQSVLDAKAYLAPEADCYIYDEGTGTYNGAEYMTYLSGDRIADGQFSSNKATMQDAKTRLSRRLVGKKGRLSPRAQFVFRPELLPGWLSEALPAARIPIPGDAGVYRCLMPEEARPDILERAKLVFLTLSDDSPNNVLRQEEILVKRILDVLGNRLILKPQPGRSNAELFSEMGCVMLPKDISWEPLVAGGFLGRDCILAGICSSAQMTPKTVFGMEQRVLLLGNLVSLSNWRSDAFESIVSLLRDSYDNPNLIEVPNDVDELYEILNRQ